MKILLDGRTLQVRTHEQTEGARGVRLKLFLEDLRDLAGREPAVCRDPLGADALDGADVLVVPTRIEDWTGDELDAVEGFVRSGGGLFLLSNHDPFHEIDGRLGARFGVAFEATFFRTPGRPTAMEGSLLTDHPLLAGEGPDEAIRSLVTNTTCSLAAGRGEPLAFLAPTMEDKHGGFAPAPGALYALALGGGCPPGPEGRGRVVCVADSGFLGNPDTTVPGPGQYDRGDNRAFVRRALRWLAGE